MKDQSDDPSHHERTFLPQSYISLPLVRSKVKVHPSFDTAFYKLSNAIGDISEKIDVIKCLCMWPINSYDLISDTVCVVDAMTFKS